MWRMAKMVTPRHIGFIQIQIQIQKGLLKYIHIYSNRTQWQYQDVYKH